MAEAASKSKGGNGTVSASQVSTGARTRYNSKTQYTILNQALRMISEYGEGNPYTRLMNPQTPNEKRIARAYKNESEAAINAWWQGGSIGDKYTSPITVQARNRGRKANS